MADDEYREPLMVNEAEGSPLSPGNTEQTDDEDDYRPDASSKMMATFDIESPTDSIKDGGVVSNQDNNPISVREAISLAFKVLVAAIAFTNVAFGLGRSPWRCSEAAPHARVTPIVCVALLIFIWFSMALSTLKQYKRQRITSLAFSASFIPLELFVCFADCPENGTAVCSLVGLLLCINDCVELSDVNSKRTCLQMCIRCLLTPLVNVALLVGSLVSFVKFFVEGLSDD